MSHTNKLEWLAIVKPPSLSLPAARCTERREAVFFYFSLLCTTKGEKGKEGEKRPGRSHDLVRVPRLDIPQRGGQCTQRAVMGAVSKCGIMTLRQAKVYLR